MGIQLVAGFGDGPVEGDDAAAVVEGIVPVVPRGVFGCTSTEVLAQQGFGGEGEVCIDDGAFAVDKIRRGCSVVIVVVVVEDPYAVFCYFGDGLPVLNSTPQARASFSKDWLTAWNPPIGAKTITYVDAIYCEVLKTRWLIEKYHAILIRQRDLPQALSFVGCSSKAARSPKTAGAVFPNTPPPGLVLSR